MIEGSGSRAGSGSGSIPLTRESGSGSRRPDNIWFWLIPDPDSDPQHCLFFIFSRISCCDEVFFCCAAEDEEHRDVFLRTESGYFQAHRLLLAAASPFFTQVQREIAPPYSSVADPGSGASLTPGSGMGNKSGSGSGMNNPDHIFESLETIFWV